MLLDAEVPVTVPLPAPPTRRVLLVEDDPAVREVASRILARRGFEVTEAADGREGLAVLRAHPGRFRVVVSDILMPFADGVELSVRARAEFPDTRFVIITGFSAVAEDVERARGLADVIIGKPFDADTLVRAVEAALQADATA
jgi:DNA-binding NtrC family response regulator